MGAHPQDLRHHAVDRARNGLLLQQLKEKEGAITGPPTINMDELMQQIKELIDQHYAAADSSLDDLETEINTLESNISDLRSAHDDLRSKIN